MRSQLFGVLVALLAVALWAGNFVIAQDIAKSIPPLQMNFWRWALSTVIVLPFCIKAIKKDAKHLWKHKVYLLAMSIIGISMMNTFVYKAGQSTSSVNMALLMPVMTIVIIVLSRILYGEAITKQRLLGIIVVLLGILCIIFKGNLENIRQVRFTAGDLWVLGATLTFGLYSLFVRRKPVEISLAAFSGVTFLLGTLAMLPFVLLEISLVGSADMNQKVIVAISYAAIACSVLGYILWSVAINIIGPVRTGFIYYTLPFFTVIEAWIFLGSGIDFAHIVGGLFIISGILLATVQKKALTLSQKN